MGECPSWYRLMQAAKYLGVAPWDLAVQPAWWQEMALTAMSSEAGAEKQKSKKASKRNHPGT